MQAIECKGPDGTRVFLNPSYIVKLIRGKDWRWRAVVDGEEGTEYIMGHQKPDGEFHPASSVEDALLEFEAQHVKRPAKGQEWGRAIRKGGSQ